jgi:hypothetical protein
MIGAPAHEPMLVSRAAPAIVPGIPPKSSILDGPPVSRTLAQIVGPSSGQQSPDAERVRTLAPFADHGRRAPGLVAPQGDHRQVDHLADLPGDGSEHVPRGRPARHEPRDAPQRRLLPREQLVAFAQSPLGAQPVLDVGERHDGTAPFPHLDRRRDVRDWEPRAIPPEEPVQIAGNRLAGEPREQHGALRGGIRSAVGVAVMDRFVAVAPDELGRTVVAECLDRGRVREPDHAVVIDDPDRLPGRAEHRGEEVLGTNEQPVKVDQRFGQTQPPITSESTPRQKGMINQRSRSPERDRRGHQDASARSALAVVAHLDEQHAVIKTRSDPHRFRAPVIDDFGHRLGDHRAGGRLNPGSEPATDTTLMTRTGVCEASSSTAARRPPQTAGMTSRHSAASQGSPQSTRPNPVCKQRS